MTPQGGNKVDNNENRVVFIDDVELGKYGEGESTGGGSISKKFSIIAPLPSETAGSPNRKRSNSSSSSIVSVNSNTAISSSNNGGGIRGTSILKKRYTNPKSSSSSISKGGASVTTSKTGGTGSIRTHSTGDSSSNGNGLYSPNANATPRHVWYSRWLFFFLLCMVAAVLGYLTYSALTDNETYLADSVFLKVAEHAIYTISFNQMKKKLGMDSMGSIVGSSGSGRDEWPFVTQKDYESIANNIIDVSRGCNIAYGPILTPVEVPAFEVFAEDFYQNTRPEPFPNGTGVKVEGRVAVWSMDGETMMPFHDISGATSAWESTRRIIVPMYQHAAGASSKLMFNMHASPLLGKTIEDMMECSEEKKELIREHNLKYSEEIILDNGEVLEPPPPPSLKDCTMVTEINHNQTSAVQKEPMGPGASMMQPIFPANDKTEMVGVLVTAIVWTETMVDVFADNIDGIDIVLSTPTQQVSFRVIKGIVTFQGNGDLHDPAYDDQKQEGDVTLPGYFANQSVHYTIALYPSDTLYEMYSTKNPYYATVGAICVMVFTVCMFVAYDCLVRREFSAKHDLLKAKRHFMRYVSHEVRTPLNSVCMGLNLMQEEIQEKLTDPNDDGTKNAMITIAEASAWLSLSRDVHISAQSATNVLNDFLNYDKIESRQLTLELSIVLIQSLVNEIVREFVLPAQDKSIVLSVLQEKVDSCDASSCAIPTRGTTKSKKKVEVDHIDQIESQLLKDQVVVGDKSRLSQVMRNVISNAIKFTPEKGSITVKTTWIVATVDESTTILLQHGQKEDLHQTGWIQIEVTDTGPGMTEDQLATVFESGVQFNRNQNQKGGGSGLGLFIAKGIVDQHNGILAVTSEGMGKGSSFVCKLPVYCKLKHQNIDNIVVPIIARDETISERVSSSWLDEHNERDLCYRILVVDDAPMNRKLLTRLLMKRGHHVDMAEDGLEAYEKVVAEMKEGRRYDTILMDFQMPVMDGPTATQRIRMEGCDSFIVGITGNVLPQDVEHFKICGADGVLGKPFQVEQLEYMWIEYGVTAD